MTESATFTEPEWREHFVYVDEKGEPDECIEDCPGCHYEGNADCEALPYGCDICDPDGKACGPCLTCGHTAEHHDPHDGCGACAMAMRSFRHAYKAA
jgi:hypothetical protein